VKFVHFFAVCRLTAAAYTLWRKASHSSMVAADDHGELLVQVAHETVAASELMQRVVPHVPMT